jgi:hypothetical protein
MWAVTPLNNKRKNSNRKNSPQGHINLELHIVEKQDAEKFGLIINQGKTKYMRNTRKEIKRQDIVIDNMTFEHVSSFKYLGAIVNETNKLEEEIQSRIAAGNRAYHANKKLLTNY